MSEWEICFSYRTAKNQEEQVQILSDLTGKSRMQIIAILLRNGEKIQKRLINQLFRRLDSLDSQIQEKEREYRDIVNALKGSKKQEV